MRTTEINYNGKIVTTEQVELVQESFINVIPIASTAAEIFYARLFELDPELRGLFTGDMRSQGRKLMSMIGAAVNGLNNVDTLLPIVQDLGKRHIGYGVSDEHYNTVAAALLYTLKKGLGELWNDSLNEAWTAVYILLSSVMVDASMGD